ncbi:MAG: hypothetical protein DYG92_11360 [Leptolyngbya sp. PLA1]|nr:hypothetical protein [Leptolyngbya sp. PLA1]
MKSDLACACTVLVALAAAAKGQLNVVAAAGTSSPAGTAFTRMWQNQFSFGIEYADGGPPVISNGGILGYIAAREGAEPGEDIWGVYIAGEAVRETGDSTEFFMASPCVSPVGAIERAYADLQVTDADPYGYRVQILVDRAPPPTETCMFAGSTRAELFTPGATPDRERLYYSIGQQEILGTTVGNGHFVFAPGRWDVFACADQYGSGARWYQAYADVFAHMPEFPRNIRFRYEPNTSSTPCRYLQPYGSIFDAGSSTLDSESGIITTVMDVCSLDFLTCTRSVVLLYPIDEGVIPSCQPSEPPVEVIAEEGTPAPGTSHCFSLDNAFPLGAVRNANNLVAFVGDLSGAGSCQTTDPAPIKARGIWVAPPNPENEPWPPGLSRPHLVVRGGDAADGVPGAVFANLTYAGSPLVLNRLDQLLFYSSLNYTSPDTGPGLGLFRVQIEVGTTDVIVTRAPLYLEGESVSLADGRTRVLDTLGYTGPPATNSVGDVLFAASATDPVSTGGGIGLYLHRSGSTHLIVETGETLPVGNSTRTVSDFRWWTGTTAEDGRRRSLNELGQVAIRVEFTDGSDAIAVWTEPPSPLSPCDYNCDGNSDQDDVTTLIDIVTGGDPPCPGQDPDFNQDGNVDMDDATALTTAIGGGGC